MKDEIEILRRRVRHLTDELEREGLEVGHLETENARLRAALEGADGLLMAAAKNLRSADKDERRVEAAFRIAGNLDKLRASIAASLNAD